MTTLQRALLIASLIAQAGAASDIAARDQFGYGPQTFDYDPSLGEQWKEIDVTIPPAPADKDLLEVPLPPAERLKLFIDSTSLSRGADRVMRYTAVLQTPGGARNAFYEGIRCETREYKTYALGNSQGVLQPVREPRWQPIPRHGHNAFRFHLYRFYLCDSTTLARQPREVMQLIKYPPLNWTE